MATISVAMATYNGERFLGEQLRSIAAQERLPDELVVADDSSVDRTWEIVAEFARTAPFPVRLHRNERRLGWRANFMSALARCGSDLIALCDQDDVWHPTKLAIAERAMDEPDIVLFFHDAWLIDGTGKRTGPANIFSFARAQSAALGLFIFQPLWLLDGVPSLAAGAIEPVGSIDRQQRSARRAPHDQWLFFLATVLGTVRFSQERLTELRQHGGNAVGQPLPTGLVSRLRRAQQYWLSNPEARFRNLAEVARDRADILAACCDLLSGRWRQRAVLGRARYQELASRLESRAELYGDRRATARASRLEQLRRSGVYGGATAWDFTQPR